MQQNGNTAGKRFSLLSVLLIILVVVFAVGLGAYTLGNTFASTTGLARNTSQQTTSTTTTTVQEHQASESRSRSVANVLLFSQLARPFGHHLQYPIGLALARAFKRRRNSGSPHLCSVVSTALVETMASTTITISEDLKRELLKVAAELQASRREKIEYDDVLRFLVRKATRNLDLFRQAGSSTGQSSQKLRETLRRGRTEDKKRKQRGAKFPKTSAGQHQPRRSYFGTGRGIAPFTSQDEMKAHA